MKSLNKNIYEYGRLVEKGDIKEAYQGVMNYILGLRTYFNKKYPDYGVSGNVYQGYMDMTFFSLAPELFKEKHLKVALVFIHEKIRFEAWLTGKNTDVQAAYRKQFREKESSKYTISPDEKGVSSIIESVLVEGPNFDNLDKLTHEIDTELKKFIEDMKQLLKSQ